MNLSPCIINPAVGVFPPLCFAVVSERWIADDQGLPLNRYRTTRIDRLLFLIEVFGTLYPGWTWVIIDHCRLSLLNRFRLAPRYHPGFVRAWALQRLCQVK